MDEMIWQEHTYKIEKWENVGFGIAISGGKDNPGFRTRDPSIIVSDVVKHGPAFNKLQVNDSVIEVNGRKMFNTTHAQAVKELKQSGRVVEITVKRKALVRVGRDTPSPGPLRRAGSRGLEYGRSRSRHRSRSRDRDSYRSKSRGRHYSSSRSRSRTPPRHRSRSRPRSRTPSSRSSYDHSPARSHRSARSRSRGRTVSPARSQRSKSSRHRSRSRRRSYSSSASRSPSPPPKHDLRSMSPLSPDPDSEKARRDPDMMVFPVKATQPKTLVLKKTRWNNSYGLKLGTRIFVQDIQPGSLADKDPNISAGDTILMINGRNVDNKTVNESIQIIGLSKEKLTMLVKKQDGGTVSIPADRFNTPGSPEKTENAPVKEPEPSRPRHHDDTPSEHSKRSSRASSKSISHKSESSIPPQTEVKPEPKINKKTVGGVQVLPSGLGAAVASKARERTESHSSTASSRSGTPAPAPRNKPRTDGHPEYEVPPGDDEPDEILPADATTIRFIKGRNVGIRLAGGNDVGIFVASVQEGSPAAKQGLKMGDQILSVNEVNFRNVIREEAVLTLMGLPAGEEVTIIAQPRPSVFQKILEHGTGDSFYVRTHFKYERSGDHEMSFKQGSIFRISDTLYQGMVGYWLAVRIGRGNMEIERGVIPNGSRAQQLKEVQDKKIQQSHERNNKGGIGRRLIKNQRKGDTLKPPPSSNQPAFPAYERVVLREAGFKRPTVIFGPLADISRQRLSGDYPSMYEIARNEGVVSGQKSNRKGVIRLNMIKDIIEKDKHAILDITPNAVEKLNYAQLYPIVVFLKPASKGTVKELRQKLAVTEDEKKKKPNKLYDRSIKMMKGYNHVFTDVIPLTQGTDDWYRKLYSTIKDQQNMPVWVSEDKLGGTEEDTEGAIIPGDDDRLSYVSAPASDYSVTTVGSEMLRDNLDDESLDGHHDDRRSTAAIMPPQQQKRYSSSSAEEGKFGDDDLEDGLKAELDEEPPTSKPQPPIGNYHRAPSPKMHEVVKPYKEPDYEDEASSTSSDERLPPVIHPESTPMRPPAKKSPEPARIGKQEIPEGRFDPQSFLKNHIKRLNRVHKEDEISSEEPAAPASEQIQPAHTAPVHQSAPVRQPAPQENRFQPPQNSHAPIDTPQTLPPPLQENNIGPPLEEPQHTTPAVLMPVSAQQPWVADKQDYNPPVAPKPISNYPLSGPRPYSRPTATQEPVYAQVNKKRPGVNSAAPPPSQPIRRDEEPQRESTGRDYSREIDSFITSDPYRGGVPTRNNFPASSRPPVRDEPQPQAPTNNYGQSTGPSYNRFNNNTSQPPKSAGYNQQPPYSSNKPSGAYRPPATSTGPSQPPTDGPPRSRFVQDKYKDYMNQLRNPEKQNNYTPPGSSSYAPRPINKTAGPPNAANKFKNGPLKDQSYDSGVDTYDTAKPKTKAEAVPVSPSSLEDDDPQVVATARGVFDSNGGVLSSVETGVSIMIPKGAISPGVKQEIYFKVCRDNTVLPPLDKNKGETLLSPLVMCGPHGLQFNHPVELRLPHSGEPSQWQNMNAEDASQVSSNSVSVLIDHF